MVRVYVYVVGVALFTVPQGPEPAWVLFPQSDYTFRGVPLPQHQMEFKVNDRDPKKHFELLSLTAGKGTVDGAGLTGGALPNLADLLPGAKVDDACIVGKCQRTDDSRRPRNGTHARLSFSGAWKTEALIDCDDIYPYRKEAKTLHNFINARRAWSLKIRDTKDLKNLRNAVLYTADVQSTEGLVTLDGKSFQLEVMTREQCQELPGFEPANYTGCSVIKVRHGSTDETDPWPGSPDVHFLSLFTLLKDPGQPENWWAPIVAGGEPSCGGGTGTAGHPVCSGAILK